MTLINLLRWKRDRTRHFHTQLTFPFGIYGFEHLRLFSWEGNKGRGPYFLLRSLEDARVRFLVADPFQVIHDFSPALCVQDFSCHGEESEFLLLAIVTPQKELNLSAPLLIDWEKREGRQILLPAQSGDQVVYHFGP